MPVDRLGVAFAATLMLVGALTACDRVSRAENPDRASDAAATVPQATVTQKVRPAATPFQAQSTSVPTKNTTNAKKATVASATAQKQQSAGPIKSSTPANAPAAMSSSNKQGDDIEQQLDQLLKDLDQTDTVNDAGN